MRASGKGVSDLWSPATSHLETHRRHACEPCRHNQNCKSSNSKATPYPQRTMPSPMHHSKAKLSHRPAIWKSKPPSINARHGVLTLFQRVQLECHYGIKSQKPCHIWYLSSNSKMVLYPGCSDSGPLKSGGALDCSILSDT